VLHHVTTPRFSPNFPDSLVAALKVIKAPPLPTLSAFMTWAGKNLIITVPCAGVLDDYDPALPTHALTMTHAHRHTIRCDPHTGHRTVRDHQDSESAPHAQHQQWAVAYPQVPHACHMATHLLDSLGEVDYLAAHADRSGIGSLALAQRILAVRDIANAVAYLDHGLGYQRSAHLLRLGFTAAQADLLLRAERVGNTTADRVEEMVKSHRFAHLGTRATIHEADFLISRLIDPTYDPQGDPFQRHKEDLLVALRGVPF
jgi:hypothetical protein